ncbi:YicC/YloC family endoribonuclease [Lysobacter soyae]|uniref:YicC family protein n=1 Tax=Lysobacter soyae TaxID=2764185 RepID=A0ABX8WRA2_9GAMM|nr:YicC/YloC family endoribonuclease [Lysobacter sp. CJ11]QYR53361.1 YicC family protein [Lysobacter sp. CJ11]
MTAYASAEAATAIGLVTCELRAVNHRFLETGVRLPDDLRSLEPALRERIASRISRGKVDLIVRVRDSASIDRMAVNEAMVERLSMLALQLSAKFPGMRTDFAHLLEMPGVMKSAEVDTEHLHVQVLQCLDQALDAFVAAREREGASLAAAIRDRAERIKLHADEVRTAIPLIRIAQRDRLSARLTEMAHSADPGRIEQEMVIALQKLDIDEELDRLDSHLAELGRVLSMRDPVGRRLDFLMQEFNREANTLGSKSVDVRTTNAAVELKVLIDQIREQVQNIE